MRPRRAATPHVSGGANFFVFLRHRMLQSVYYVPKLHARTCTLTHDARTATGMMLTAGPTDGRKVATLTELRHTHTFDLRVH